MLPRALCAGAAALVLTAPLTAQQRGTIELGGFASNTSFDSDLGMNSAWGGGGRVGAFLHPRLSVEFEGGATRASRDLGLQRVNIGVLSGRLTAVPLKSGRLAVLVGAGFDHTDADIVEGYGVHGLLGAKFALRKTGDLRLETVRSYMTRGRRTNSGIHIGLSFYRNPFGRVTTVTRTVIGPSIAQQADSVSAHETRRLRDVEASYGALRDSLDRSGRYARPSSFAALATMQEMIYFQNDRSDLSDAAKAILEQKVTVFRANPAMRIVISGFASEPGTAAYNMALGLRRAEEAKAFLVSQGVDPIRIEIATQGEGQLMFEGPSESVNAANRRGQFRLLIADPYLVRPKQ